MNGSPVLSQSMCGTNDVPVRFAYFRLSLDDVLAAGQDLIAHSEEVLKHAQGDFSSANIDRLARAIAASGTWVTPTLTTSRNVLAVLDDFEAELDRPEVRALHPMSLGMRTDLVLLGRNLLAEISNTRQISGVVVGGRWISDEPIRSGMESRTEGSL